MIKNIGYIVSSIIFLCFYFVCQELINHPNLDIAIWNFVKEVRTDDFTLFFKFITHLGDAWFLVILSTTIVFYLAFVKKEWFLSSYFASAILFGSWFFNKFLKNIYKRPRPFLDGHIDNILNEVSYSFPSGHAMGSSIVYLLLAYVLTRFITKRIFVVLIFCCSLLLATVIAMSRVYLGVHYPTDILAGLCMAYSYVLLSLCVYEIILRRRNES